MADLPVNLSATALAERLARCIDVEGKIPRALESLGPIHERDVVLVDAGVGLRARQLAELGGRVVAVERTDAIAALHDGLAAAEAAEQAEAAAGSAEGNPIRVAEGSPTSLPVADSSMDAVVGCWSVFRGPPDDELAEADRVLRPGGRLLVIHDYGRDDVSALRGPDQPEYGDWSRRDGTFLRRGFKIRVIHCFWTFGSIDEAQELLAESFGDAGRRLAAGLRRPRLSYNVAIYHRTKGDLEAAPAA